MSDIFILRNQAGEFLNKAREWIAAGDSKTLFRSTHRDDMLNEKVELTVKNPFLRIEILAAQQLPNGRIERNGTACLPHAVVDRQDNDHSDDALKTENTDEGINTEQAIIDLPTKA